MVRAAVRAGVGTMLLSLALLSSASRARADDRPTDVACPAVGPIIEARVAEDVAIDRDRLLRLLRVELAARNIGLCVGPAPRKSVATIDLAPHEADVTLTIHVTDRLTQKDVTRDVPVGAYPPDARPLLVAAAMDELLRASWS